MGRHHWSLHVRRRPGEGVRPVADVAAAVAGTGYDGYFSLEIFNDQFRGGSPRAIAADGRRSLVYLGDQVRRRPDAAGLTLPAMPDRQPVGGVAFVEFSAGEGGAAALVAILRTLGFRRTAAHRSKKVSVSQQIGRASCRERGGQYV